MSLRAVSASGARIFGSTAGWVPADLTLVAVSSFKTWLQRIATQPMVYDWIQRAAGASVVHRRLMAWLRFAHGAVVLDVGGGTSGLKPLLNGHVTHVCLDIERPKLLGYARTFHDARPLQGDAASLPVRDGSVDAVTLALVTHHLDDDQIERAVDEAARVLMPRGALLVCDAIWTPSRRIGRVLWKYDRGGHPRTRAQLEDVLRRRFRIVRVDRFSVFHAYVVVVLCESTGVSSQP